MRVNCRADECARRGRGTFSLYCLPAETAVALQFALDAVILEALRPSKANGRQRGSAGGDMQKFAAGKFHFEPPFTSFDHLVGAGEQGRHWPSANSLRRAYSNAKMRFQSFFMLTTVQPPFFASS